MALNIMICCVMLSRPFDHGGAPISNRKLEVCRTLTYFREECDCLVSKLTLVRTEKATEKAKLRSGF
jgi:hypothetical protein